MKVVTWPPPDHRHAVPCPFGNCGQTDRSKCVHGRMFSWTADKKKINSDRTADYRCSCRKPAMGECSFTVLCGHPICRQFGRCSVHGGSHV